jgi:hypothetical protein
MPVAPVAFTNSICVCLNSHDLDNAQGHLAYHDLGHYDSTILEVDCNSEMNDFYPDRDGLLVGEWPFVVQRKHIYWHKEDALCW